MLKLKKGARRDVLGIIATACAVALAITLGVLSWMSRDITLHLSKEGCDVLGEMKVATLRGDTAGTCKLVHADVSAWSLVFDHYMYSVTLRDTGDSFDIAKGLVTGGGRPGAAARPNPTAPPGPRQGP